MPDIFADTSGWANFFIRTEPFHLLAKEQMQSWYKKNARIITSNYVLAELIALLTSPLRLPRPRVISTVETIKSAIWVKTVHVDYPLDQEAWNLLKERPDKEWSMVDCASMVIMKHFHISETFTSDHHFEQAGYSITLK